MPALNYSRERQLWPLKDTTEDARIREAFLAHIDDKLFPCVAAKAALGLNHIDTFFGTHLGCPADDVAVLEFLYDFVGRVRSEPKKYSTVAVIFRDATEIPETMFDHLMWSRLQALADLDRRQYRHDPRVSADPASPDFSFSLKEEAFYIIGLHGGSSRPARRFAYPTLVFNLHAQFEALRREGKYEAMKSVIRKRDMAYSGSVNPMLSDFGRQSEAAQYSGKFYESGWRCPLNLNIETNGDYSTT